MWLSGAKRLRQQSEVYNNIHHFDVEVAPTHRSRLALLSTNVDPHEKQLVINVNVDWFQPYKHLTYSIGAIYASLPQQFHYQMSCNTWPQRTTSNEDSNEFSSRRA